MNRLLSIVTIAAMALWGPACTIIDPLLIALNLPLEVCAAVNAGNSWDETESFDIEQEIEDISVDYLDDVKATRISDILIYMPNPPTGGAASGSISYQFAGDPAVTVLATFSNVPFDSLKSPGISILHTSLITLNPAALADLIARFSNPDGLPPPTTVTLFSQGSTTVAVVAGTQVCAKIEYQVDVEI